MFEFYKTALQGGGITNPLCAEYKNLWRGCGNDKERLVSLVMHQQAIPFFATFCYQSKGLTKEYCKQEFSDFINGFVLHDCDAVKGFTYGMWIDALRTQEIALKTDVSSFMWCDDVSVTIENTKCPVIYVSNKSNIHLSLNGYNFVKVYLFDESSITIDNADETCKVLVYRYSTDAKVEQGKYCFCDVRVFDKELRL